MAQLGETTRLGIDTSEAMIFPLEGGSWEFAGDAVNIASEQAECYGEAGHIYISSRSAADISVDDGVPFSATISSVTLSGFAIPP